MMGALDHATRRLVVHTSRTKRSADFIAFLEVLDRLYGPRPGLPMKPVVIVLDNGPIHVSKATSAALADTRRAFGAQTAKRTPRRPRRSSAARQGARRSDDAALRRAGRHPAPRAAAALLPGARAVTALAPSGETLAAFRRVHEAGLFEAEISERRDYRLCIDWDGVIQETEDPYSPSPRLRGAARAA